MDQFYGHHYAGGNYDQPSQPGGGDDEAMHMSDADMSSMHSPHPLNRAHSQQSHQNTQQNANNNAYANQQRRQQEFNNQMNARNMANFSMAPTLQQQQAMMNAANASMAGASNGNNSQQQGNAEQQQHQQQQHTQQLPMHMNQQNMANYNMMPQIAAYQQMMNQNAKAAMNMQGMMMPPNMQIPIDYSDPHIINNLLKSGIVPPGLMVPNQMVFGPMMANPMLQNLSMANAMQQMQGSGQNTVSGQQASQMSQNNSMQHGGMEHFEQKPEMSSTQSQARHQNMSHMQQTMDTGQSSASQIHPSHMGSSFRQDQNTSNASMPIRPHPQQTYKNAYSSTGFDMLTVLMRIATRPNPEIEIGAVDLSCAFVVCDAEHYDMPIVYCTENFERLTGYTKHEILGRNCRFLQAPNGAVQAGFKRSYCDDDSVYYLKRKIIAREESQVSLINYRKGGQPFMNLLTMIPIGYDTDEVKFFVGFQVDLVEQPNSITSKNQDGTYMVNYQRGLTMPRYVFQGTKEHNTTLESGQTIPRDEVSSVLLSVSSGESELSKHIWDKVLLENTDDVVFVLSLKGLFLYLSPSCKVVLEYDASELIGTALSSVCHPSDIVPVTRELKDSTSTASVDVVFRIRRKQSGYTWFEGHGALHTEQGKGRKSIVLVGRERPVYTLSTSAIFASGGIAESEVWTKLSTSGMFLFVSSNIRSLLDRLPSELIGTSIQALMRPDSRPDFLRILDVARSGRKASAKHELLNKRGQVMQAFSTVYPGDATIGSKPTFFVAQTRLLKFRPYSVPGNRPSATTKAERDSTSVGSVSKHSASPATTNQFSQTGSGGSTPARSAQSANNGLPSPQDYMGTFEAATTFAGQDGLPLGHQDAALASHDNLFEELKTTRSTSWQFELRQLEKRNRLLAEELQFLLAARKKRKRRKGPAGAAAGQPEKDCANCHTKSTPEWRRGPSGKRDLCNSCGLRWAKQQGRISPRTNSQRSAHSGKSEKASGSPLAHADVQSPDYHASAVANTVAATTGSGGSGAGGVPVRNTSAPNAGSSAAASERKSIEEALSGLPAQPVQSQSQSLSLGSQPQSPGSGGSGNMFYSPVKSQSRSPTQLHRQAPRRSSYSGPGPHTVPLSKSRSASYDASSTPMLSDAQPVSKMQKLERKDIHPDIPVAGAGGGYDTVAVPTKVIEEEDNGGLDEHDNVVHHVRHDDDVDDGADDEHDDVDVDVVHLDASDPLFDQMEM